MVRPLAMWAIKRVQVQPSDERVAMVILEIADFLLEFSSLGHEDAADTPQFVHPQIPNEVRIKRIVRYQLNNADPLPLSVTVADQDRLVKKGVVYDHR